MGAQNFLGSFNQIPGESGARLPHHPVRLARPGRRGTRLGHGHPARGSCRRLAFPDKRRLRQVATDISIASGIVVSLLVVDRQVMTERGDFSLFENIRDEGIAV
jgi:hypothetical protein